MYRLKYISIIRDSNTDNKHYHKSCLTNLKISMTYDMTEQRETTKVYLTNLKFICSYDIRNCRAQRNHKIASEVSGFLFVELCHMTRQGTDIP